MYMKVFVPQQKLTTGLKTNGGFACFFPVCSLIKEGREVVSEGPGTLGEMG